MTRKPIPPVPDEPRPIPGAKDRKRLCKALAWAEHDSAWMDAEEVWEPSNTPQIVEAKRLRKERQITDGGRHTWHNDLECLVCKACGKQLKWREKGGAR